MSEYMAVLVLAGIIPFILSFWPALKFYSNLKSLLKTLILIVIIFGSWDVFATARGHWYFNPDGVGKLRIINLPIEEVLFFIVIPFCCIFTWEAVIYIKERLK